MTDVCVFRCAGRELDIELVDAPGSETMRQFKAWLPATVTIHCAKIAGCHIYWPSPILASLESGRDIHSLPPGSLLYYPDRQYIEIIYDKLQAETASVTYLGRMKGGADWLSEFASRQRERSGFEVHTAELFIQGTESAENAAPTFGEDTAWDRIRRLRQAAWASEPEEVERLFANEGLNIPFGPMAISDGYYRAVQESLWQLWSKPDRFSDDQVRAAAINAMELGIARLGHYCHLTETEALLNDAIACVSDKSVPLQALLAEVILFCGKMANWIDVRIPWFEANELTKRALGRAD